MNAIGVQTTRRGFTLIELIAIVVVSGLMLVVVVVVARARFHKSARIACAGNMKQIGLSFRIFANDNGTLYPMRLATNRGGTLESVSKTDSLQRHFETLSNYLSTPVVLRCPADVRKPATSFSTLANTNISYFLGLDADQTRPGLLLAGDRNLQRDGIPLTTGIWELPTNRSITWGPGLHTRQNGPGLGNVVLADGSVQQVTDDGLQSLLRNTGDATNRIAIP